eukprot:TRINITY_DN2657_c0_g1_i1.p1 TRINITY_DN2657_c0_g1~~TRINITY_DN2657_c0_g1_i1.p1  ORF type:complete len:341 (-),score=31.10 TRINITY_DN2657_c0_g1_i1:89-1111(-)
MTFLKSALPLVRRALSTSAAANGAPPRKVAVLGAGGGIGQPLSLLMKTNPLVTELSLYDVAGTPGVTADISHICSNSKVKGFTGPDELAGALQGADVVLIPAGVPRKPGMTRQDLFNINAGIVKGLCESIAKHCPEAAIGMISNPVNSTVPIAAEVFKGAGTYDPRKLFGVTTLDIVRARTFYAEAKGLNAEEVTIPVVGGHAGATIIPLFSQASPAVGLSDEEREALTVRTQDGGTEVVQAKAGKGSATLSMAYAASVFANALLRAMNGAPDIIECSYVENNLTEVPFFAARVRLGPRGVEEVLPIGSIIPYEERAIRKAIPELAASIQAGIDFVHGQK